MARHSLLRFSPANAGYLAGRRTFRRRIRQRVLWIISEGYFRLRKREGMGLGDVKMMLMAGAFLGLKRTVLTILLGSILGSIIGVAFIAIRRKGRITNFPSARFLVPAR